MVRAARPSFSLEFYRKSRESESESESDASLSNDINLHRLYISYSASSISFAANLRDWIKCMLLYE